MPTATKKATTISSNKTGKAVSKMVNTTSSKKRNKNPKYTQAIPSAKNSKKILSDDVLKTYASKKSQYDTNIAKSIRGSTRLYGIPHQLLPHNDVRIGSNKGISGLGEMYAEKIVMEAPIVHFKPGKSKFMPGESSSTKKGMLNALSSAIKGDYSELEEIINSESPGDDVIRYFGFEEDFSNYMSKVNLLCRFMAHFLGISNERVPWAKHVSFGHYDWRYYKFKKTMNAKADDMGANEKGIGTFISDVFEKAAKSIEEDDMYVSFYVDSGASFSESASNTTTQSAIKQFTDQISSVAKELQTVSGMTGLDAQGLADSVGSSLDSFSQSIDSGGPLSTLMKRITSTAGQLIQGANFLVPEIWSDSEYSRSYSIPITLATPYGNKLSWYLNIGVPLCFILGLALPHGSTANTYTSPHIVQCFSQGWFNCGMGIIDSIGLDKGSDGSWNALGLPNEIKVSLNVRDLYSSLTLPKSDNALGFMQNTGMLEFLLVNSGVDLSVNKLGSVWKLWKFMFTDQFTNKIQSAPYDLLISLRNKMNSMGKILK